jgi:hypothetical protein
VLFRSLLSVVREVPQLEEGVNFEQLSKSLPNWGGI